MDIWAHWKQSNGQNNVDDVARWGLREIDIKWFVVGTNYIGFIDWSG